MKRHLAGVLPLGIIVLLSACTRWESYEIPTTPIPALPSYVRVFMTGQGSTVLVDPSVRHDTLYGRSRGDTLGIAMAEVERLERPRVDGLRTAGTVVGSVAAWLTLGLLAQRGE